MGHAAWSPMVEFPHGAGQTDLAAAIGSMMEQGMAAMRAMLDRLANREEAWK
jgi:hypothetical protein